MDPIRLWTGKTVHKRYQPFERRFSYDIFLIDLDIDRLEEAGRVTPLFRINAPGLFSFRTEDHGPREPGASLRDWAEDMFACAGIHLNGGAIRLVTFARHLFFKFAPLSLWYGYDASGRLAGIIYEVNNTFGESHAYVAALNEPRCQHEAGKAFHVSPFMDVAGKYRFTLRIPDQRLLLMVENQKDNQRTHLAGIAARRRPVTSLTLLQLALTRPLSSIGVVAAIHWQALFIWLRGAGYRRRPPAPATASTMAFGTREPRIQQNGQTS